MRLDQYMAELGIVSSRSQAASYIKLGSVRINGNVVTKPGVRVLPKDKVFLTVKEQYVSRAALKLASVASSFDLSFAKSVVLDVGSSTGGFTDYALQHGASRVIAVDVGTQQMDARLRLDPRIELHEQTDIRDFTSVEAFSHIVVDVSFISIRKIIEHLCTLSQKDTIFVLMAKPQFEAESQQQLNKGVVKNNAIRRKILQGFEASIKQHVKIMKSMDSKVSGEKGNIERFYMCVPLIQELTQVRSGHKL